ncbi:unnamed protein product [Periconia digitata]|uniref:Uncharacterized protein n=1 Tax=Periconia digitata TaxID=1303443 RepID=A0A9W4XJU6_9PLEO|nr:unnamed protein product [Periconia digitata]
MGPLSLLRSEGAIISHFTMMTGKKRFPASWIEFSPTGENVDIGCYRACWDSYFDLYSVGSLKTSYAPPDLDVPTNWTGFREINGETLCERNHYARYFQRCYISQCGGLKAVIPILPNNFTWDDSLRAWAWMSVYMDVYNSDLMERFLPSEKQKRITTSWDGFPLGLTAACSRAPDQVFMPDLNDDELIRLKNMNSSEGRFPVSLSTRKMLMPMWTFPNLLQHWDYTPDSRKDEDKIQEPRSLMDLRKSIIATYLFAFVAYAHLLSITSRSQAYVVEGAHLLAFCLNPFLPVLQILHNIIDAGLLILKGEPFEWLYLFAGILGTIFYQDASGSRESFRARLLEIEVIEFTTTRTLRDSKWWLRLIGIAVNLALLLFSVIPYFLRLGHRAATGIDHRVGWVAMSALVSTLATLAMHAIGREWTLRLHVPPHRNTERWQTRLALAMAMATMLLEFLLNATSRITATQILFTRILQGREHLLLAPLVTLVLGITSAWGTLSRMYSNPNRWFHKAMPWIFISIASGYTILVCLLQIFMDMEECADLALDFVLPWNARWQVQSPRWAQWWGL